MLIATTKMLKEALFCNTHSYVNPKNVASEATKCLE